MDILSELGDCFQITLSPGSRVDCPSTQPKGLGKRNRRRRWPCSLASVPGSVSGTPFSHMARNTDGTGESLNGLHLSTLRVLEILNLPADHCFSTPLCPLHPALWFSPESSALLGTVPCVLSLYHSNMSGFYQCLL